MKVYAKDRKLNLTVEGELRWAVPYTFREGGKIRQDVLYKPLSKYKVQKSDIVSLLDSRMLVTIQGGIIQDVYSTHPTEVTILDIDQDGWEPVVETIPEPMVVSMDELNKAKIKILKEE